MKKNVIFHSIISIHLISPILYEIIILSSHLMANCWNWIKIKSTTWNWLTHSPGPQPIWSMTITNWSFQSFARFIPSALLLIYASSVYCFRHCLKWKIAMARKKKYLSVDSFRLNEIPVEETKQNKNVSKQKLSNWI